MNEAPAQKKSKRGRPPCEDINLVISNIDIACASKRKCSRITSDFFRTFLVNIFLDIRSKNNPYGPNLTEDEHKKLVSLTESNHQLRAKSIRKVLSTIPNIATSIEGKFLEEGNLMGVFLKMFTFTYIGNPEFMDLTAKTLLRIFTKKIQKDYDDVDKKIVPSDNAGKCRKKKKIVTDTQEESSFDEGDYLNLTDQNPKRERKQSSQPHMGRLPN